MQTCGRLLPMPVKTEKDLPSDARALWLKGIHALELRNYDYAVSLFQTVLKETPDFLEGRRALRKTEVLATKGKKSFLSGMSTAGLKGAGLVKKDPKAALELAEKTLESEPYSQQGNMLLHDAAIAAGFIEVAGFALETLVEANPKDTKALHALANHFYENGMPDKAVEIYNRITELHPADLIAIKRGKDSAARASMTQGKWEEVAASGGAKDYRDLIKNKDEAISLEQKNRVVKSDEMIEQQLAELMEQYAANQTNVDLVRRIAGLYEQKGDLNSALEWYNYTSSLSNNTDPAVARKASDIGMLVLQKSITEFEEWLAQYGDAENAGEVREQLAALQKQQAEGLISEARKRVERNPTDHILRFELGEQLLLAGHPTEAIPELQQARRNPSVRLKAMGLLGDCYVSKNMLDFATRTYSEACKEMPAMDDLKKATTYKLGLIYEKMGDRKQYIDKMKEIYEIDYGYRDVATRVESSYEE